MRKRFGILFHRLIEDLLSCDRAMSYEEERSIRHEQHKATLESFQIRLRYILSNPNPIDRLTPDHKMRILDLRNQWAKARVREMNYQADKIFKELEQLKTPTI